jgi:hypothetical protein
LLPDILRALGLHRVENLWRLAMNTSLWTEHLKRRLTAKLEKLQNGNYATAVSENLTVVLDGFAKSWTPEQVAQEIFSIERAALGLKREPSNMLPE